MEGLFKVVYFDPRLQASNMQAVRVIAENAMQAIRKADREKTLKRYKVEEVTCLGWSDA